jgi:hypothetical protein
MSLEPIAIGNVGAGGGVEISGYWVSNGEIEYGPSGVTVKTQLDTETPTEKLLYVTQANIYNPTEEITYGWGSAKDSSLYTTLALRDKTIKSNLVDFVFEGRSSEGADGSLPKNTGKKPNIYVEPSDTVELYGSINNPSNIDNSATYDVTFKGRILE